jgi:hypothetical protein
MVFGCCGGKVFEKWYEREGAYRAALRRYEGQVRREQDSARGMAPRNSITRTPRRPR